MGSEVYRNTLLYQSSFIGFFISVLNALYMISMKINMNQARYNIYHGHVNKETTKFHPTLTL